METVLVAKYFEVLVMLGEIGCLWWASATILCMSIIKMTLEYAMTARFVLYFQGIVVLIGLFFMSLIGYGLFCALYIVILKEAVLPLVSINMLRASNIPLIFDMAVFFYLICTTTFVFMFVGWIYILAAKSEKLKKEGHDGTGMD